MRIDIDRKVYSDECVSKCIYSLLDTFECQRTLCDDKEIVDIRLLVPMSEQYARELFVRSLNDYKAREVIAKETKDIRTILYAKAFADCDDYDEEAE